LLRQLAAEGDDFLLNIVTGDGSRFHYSDPDTRRQNAGSHHAASPKKLKARTAHSAVKIVAPVFWDAERCILVNFLPRKENTCISAVRYVQVLQKLRCLLIDKRQTRQILSSKSL
jgi:hypothetical protein